MARRKEFDVDVVLDKAMHLFWLQGYTATSIEDLCNAMGIKRGSLYDTFTDKRSLFLSALERYLNQPPPIAEQMESDIGAKEKLSIMFNHLVDEAVEDAQCRGCFMVNTISELASVDEEIAAIGKGHLQRHEARFLTLLTQAEADGDIASGQDLQAKARFLVSSMYGLRITGKITQDRTTLQNIADNILTIIR